MAGGERISIALDDEHSLELARSAEAASCACRSSRPSPANIHLTVMKDGAPWVCRNAALAELDELFAGDVEHLFQGRLQLKRDDAGVRVDAKGAALGSLSVSDLRAAAERVSRERR
jgi:hypothetical protein